MLISAPHLIAVVAWPNGLHHCAIVWYGNSSTRLQYGVITHIATKWIFSIVVGGDKKKKNQILHFSALTQPCYTKLQFCFWLQYLVFGGSFFILSQTEVIQHGKLHQQ